MKIASHLFLSLGLLLIGMFFYNKKHNDIQHKNMQLAFHNSSQTKIINYPDWPIFDYNNHNTYSPKIIAIQGEIKHIQNICQELHQKLNEEKEKIVSLLAVKIDTTANYDNDYNIINNYISSNNINTLQEELVSFTKNISQSIDNISSSNWQNLEVDKLNKIIQPKIESIEKIIGEKQKSEDWAQNEFGNRTIQSYLLKLSLIQKSIILTYNSLHHFFKVLFRKNNDSIEIFPIVSSPLVLGDSSHIVIKFIEFSSTSGLLLKNDSKEIKSNNGIIEYLFNSNTKNEDEEFQLYVNFPYHFYNQDSPNQKSDHTPFKFIK